MTRPDLYARMVAFADAHTMRFAPGQPTPQERLATALDADRFEASRRVLPTATCICVDGWRNQPLINCPHCLGEGTVTK